MATISLPQAVQMTTSYRENKDSILSPEQPAGTLPICETFDKEQLRAFMDDDNCKSLRMYYSLDANGNITSIIVGADEAGDDMLPSVNNDNYLLITTDRCPVACPPASVLNTD